MLEAFEVSSNEKREVNNEMAIISAQQFSVEETEWMQEVVVIQQEWLQLCRCSGAGQQKRHCCKGKFTPRGNLQGRRR